ncbi:DUF4870 domain-containing protein [Virgisporangium ochraceum]
MANMTEPPRPSGDPNPDPSAPSNPYTMPGETPGSGYSPPPSAPSSGPGGGYSMPGGSDYQPPAPSSGAGYTPPGQTSGAGYAPPSSGAGHTYPSEQQAYQQPSGQNYGGAYGAAAGGYGVQPGYPQQGGYGTPPPGYPTADDKTYALIAHWGGAAGVFVGGGFLGWVGPLIAYVAKGNVSPTVRAHAISALNFHITWAIAYALSFVVAIITCGFLFFVPLIVWLVPMVFGIIGGVKATNGEFYRYPMSIQFIK